MNEARNPRTERDNELTQEERGRTYWRSSWPKRAIMVVITSHLILLGLGWWLGSSPEHLPDIIAETALIGIVLHSIAILQRDRPRSILRVVAKGLLTWLVCLVSWLVVFWLVALFTTYNALLFGLLAAPVLGLFTSGTLATLRVGGFGK